MSTVLTTCGAKLKTLLGNFHLNETEIEDITMSFKNEMEAEVLHSANQFLCNYAHELVYNKLCNVTFSEPVVMGYKHQRVKGHLVRKRLLGYSKLKDYSICQKFGISFKIPGYQMIIFLEMCVMAHMLKSML